MDIRKGSFSRFFMEKKKRIRLMPGYLILILWTCFTFATIGWVVFASFSTTSEIFKGNIFCFASGFHPENYKKALIYHKVAVYFTNSLIYTLVTCSLIILIAAPAAYALSRFEFIGNKWIQSLFIAGLGIPSIMIIMPLFGIIAKAGLNNRRSVVMVLFLGIILPFTCYFLLVFFKTIPGDYAEAAAIDGCGPIKTFWLIMLPFARHGVITVTIFNSISIWNEYFISLIFANDTSLRPVAVGLFAMIQSMQYTGDWAGMFAAVVIVFLPTFFLYIFLSDRIVAGITEGGIKG